MAKELQGRASDERYGVIRVLDTFQFRGHNCLVVELLKRSLKDVVRKGSAGRIYPRRLREYTGAILDFLLYAKGRGVVHADIKPDNILLTADGKVRVNDFGCSFYLKYKTQTVGGTLPYMAPELLLGYRVTCAVDMWALGCTVAELATGKVLFNSQTYKDHLHRCIEMLGMPPKKMVDEAPYRKNYFDSEGLPDNLSKLRPPGSIPLHRVLWGRHPQLVDFVSRCLQWDPKLRMTPKKALAHSWLQTIITTTTTTSSTPTTSRATPTTSKATPTASKATPTASRATPTASKATPNASKATPTASKATPTASRATPTASKATPNASKATPNASQATPTASRATPTTSRATPTASRATPTANKATPTASRATPTTSRATPTTSRATPTDSKATPTASKATPTASKATPTTSRATPTTSRATSTTSRATPTTSRATPTHTEQKQETGSA
ncbi:dual specificity tyrosine-phosphorylation-regulated kinase 4-like [Petromyzon marinus]|uniref:dual specificity tyrosine-phosphorylation-regulated kinase 4-like n=1 Tax=Petromyzon marinus TaxID=7757 RepID=UPI003F71466E